MTARARLMLAALFACLCTAPGCVTTRIIPPSPRPPDAVPVFVTDYGRHSSLLLRQPEGHYNEYAFGDYDWFALSRTSAGGAVRAMLASRRSTLARRQIGLPDESPDAVAFRTRAAKVIRLEVSDARVRDLGSRLDRAFFARHNEATFNPLSSMWFVPAGEDYGAFHNCNHITARWLRKLGCDVRGAAMFSKFVLDQASDAPSANASRTRPSTLPISNPSTNPSTMTRNGMSR